MSTIAPAPPRPDVAPPTEAHARFSWTRERYDRAVETGVFGPDDKIELIEGQIVPKMPQNNPHQVTTGIASDALREVFGDGAHTRDEKAIALSDLSKPEPDVAVVRGQRRDYLERTPDPSDILLLVEVADTTLLSDRTRKARIYAEADIVEYWIVNLQDSVLEVHRDPVGGAVSPVHAPGASVAVADLLP